MCKKENKKKRKKIRFAKVKQRLMEEQLREMLRGNHGR